MKNIAMKSFSALILFFTGYSTNARADALPIDTDAVVVAVMKDQYGSRYDAKHRCWMFTPDAEQGGSAAYCMRPGRPSVVDTMTGKQLYLYAANAYDIQDDSRYSYGHNEPGLLGVFQIQLDLKGGWTYVARDNAMTFGTEGYCGCNDAHFVKLSNQGDYGWLFVSGGTWQGVTVADYSIVMAHKGRFVDISNIPQITEAEQDTKYEVAIIDDHRRAGMFPLSVTKLKDDGKVKEFQVTFNPKAFTYSLPGSH